MSQDIVADSLNQIMNAKKAKKDKLLLAKRSKLLLGILAIGKLRGYIKSYDSKENQLEIEIGDKFNACKVIKPRFVVKYRDIDKYIRRYLPARDLGILIISTSKGLMTHHTALDQKIGGSLVAYFY